MRKKKKFEITKKEVIISEWVMKCPKCGGTLEADSYIIDQILNGRLGGYGFECSSCKFEECITKEDLVIV